MAIDAALIGNLAGGTGISWIELPPLVEGDLPPNTVTVDGPSIILATAEGEAAALIYEFEDGLPVSISATVLTPLGEGDDEAGNTVARTVSAGEYVVVADSEYGYLPCRYALIPLEV